MHWSMNAAAFKDALKVTSYLHVSDDVLLTAEKGKEGGVLILESADNGSYLRMRVPAKVIAPGKTSLSRKYLNGLRLGETMECKLQGPTFGYRSGRLQGTTSSTQDGFKIEGMRPAKAMEPDVTLDQEKWSSLLATTNFSAELADAGSLPLRVLIKDGHLVGYISENFRAALYRGKLPKDQRKQAVSFTVNPDLLRAVTAGLDNPVQLGVKKGVLCLQSSTMTAYLPLNQADNSDDVLAKVATIREEASKKKADKGFRIKAKATFDAAEFLKGLTTTGSTLLDTNSRDVRVRCDVSAKEIVLTVKASHGKASYTVPVTDGPSTTTRAVFSYRYLCGMLGLVGKTELTMSIFDGLALFDVSDQSVTLLMATVQQDDTSDEDEKPSGKQRTKTDGR